jgi:hypothetical protein
MRRHPASNMGSPMRQEAALTHYGSPSRQARTASHAGRLPNLVHMRWAQISELIQSNGWSYLFREALFLGRTAVIVEKQLSEVAYRPEPLKRLGLKVVEIDLDMIASGSYRFALEYRHLKALRYLRNGYGGFGLARSNVIVGDQWYYFAETTDDPRVLHEDLRRFGFRSWTDSDAYTFDIYVAPSERKQGVSAAFQNNGMFHLRSKGFTKAYGFYFADNIPAFWCTRITNKWTELRRARISRFLLFKKVVLQPNGQAAKSD